MPPAKKRKSKISRGGTPTTLDRDVGIREIQPFILILTEGEKTEPLYFQALCRAQRLSSVQVKVIGAGVDPTQLVREAVKRRDTLQTPSAAEGEIEIWCVFDRESADSPVKLEQAIAQADKEGIELAISNPAFELWYLLHLEDTSRPFQKADHVIQALEVLLKRDGLPTYTKSSPKMYAHLQKYQAEAIKRASRLASHTPHAPPTIRSPNPSTLVYRLVQRLQELKSK